MAIKTIIYWNNPEFDHIESEFKNKLFRMQDLGLTNGRFEIDENQNTVRTWSTVEAAQEWVDYLNTFTPPPMVARVVENSLKVEV